MATPSPQEPTPRQSAPGNSTPGEQQRLSARETWGTLYRHFRPHRGIVALGTFCSLIGAATGLLQPLAAKALVERLGDNGSIAGVLAVLTALVLLATAIEAVGAYVLERTAESVVFASRRSLVGRLLRLRVAEVERTEPGDLMFRVTSDTTLLRAVTTQSVVSAVARDITALVVAHRLSTVTLAGQIVVMDAGKVRATGSHAELVAGDPLYGELAATRFLATCA